MHPDLLLIRSTWGDVSYTYMLISNLFRLVSFIWFTERGGHRLLIWASCRRILADGSRQAQCLVRKRYVNDTAAATVTVTITIAILPRPPPPSPPPSLSLSWSLPPWCPASPSLLRHYSIIIPIQAIIFVCNNMWLLWNIFCSRDMKWRLIPLHASRNQGGRSLNTMPGLALRTPRPSKKVRWDLIGIKWGTRGDDCCVQKLP